MLFFIKKNIRSFLKINEKNKYKYECAKICSIYVVIGLLWIYFSDGFANKIAADNGMLLVISRYKGWLYVFITGAVLYGLIKSLLKKVDLTENKLNESYEELTASNEELQAYVQQLTASEEELRIQYDQITESENKLKKSEQKNKAIIKAIPDLLFVFDSDGNFVDCMVNDENRLYMPKDTFIGKNLWDIMPKDIAQISYEKIQSVLKNGVLEKFEYKLLGLNYELRMVKNNENEVLAIARDITIERQTEHELKVSEERYKTLINEMQQGVALFEGSSDKEEVLDYRLLSANESYGKLTGVKPKEDIGNTVREILPILNAEQIEKLNHVIKTGQSVYYQHYFENDDNKCYEVIAYRPKKLQLAAIVNNITERKQMQERLEFLSYHDQLTGLYNRRFLEKELKRIDIEENLPLTIIMGDVNGLKLVNDSFGHSMGDELLKKIVEVLKNGCRENDIIARLSGDEFVILMPKTNENEAGEVVSNIKALALQEKVASIDISISLGYGTKVKMEEQLEEVLKIAEDHMYKKKLFDSPSMRGKTINAIISTLNEKNKREEQHSHRVSKLCEAMGEVLGLPEDEIKELKTVGLLHDIGKIAIEENILNKPGKLTNDEWEEIKRHPEIGYRILSTVNDMSEMAEYVLAHHEKWNGMGYPKNLKGEEIPFQSRIIAIADAYDAMVSERSYRAALSEETAIEELKKNAGIQFDEKLVKIFIENVLGAH